MAILGYNVIGASLNSRGAPIADKAVLPVNAIITAMHVYGFTNATVVRLAIYADNGANYPGAFVMETANMPSPGWGTPAWVDFVGLNQFLLAGTYWLAYWCDGNIVYYGDAGGSGTDDNTAAGLFPNWNDPWGFPGFPTDPSRISIYADYDPAGGVKLPLVGVGL